MKGSNMKIDVAEVRSTVARLKRAGELERLGRPDVEAYAQRVGDALAISVELDDDAADAIWNSVDAEVLSPEDHALIAQRAAHGSSADPKPVQEGDPTEPDYDGD
jgi:hypothetical protein